MGKNVDRSTQELLADLRSGSASERLRAVQLLGKRGDVQAIPALRRTLKRLKAPVPYGEEPIGEPTDDAHWVYDPDGELRVAILNAITRLLLDKKKETTTPVLKQVKRQIINLPDGSQLSITVNEPADAEGSLAASFFREHLTPLLKQIETMG
jgi:hypothetical protein